MFIGNIANADYEVHRRAIWLIRTHREKVLAFQQNITFTYDPFEPNYERYREVREKMNEYLAIVDKLEGQALEDVQFQVQIITWIAAWFLTALVGRL